MARQDTGDAHPRRMSRRNEMEEDTSGNAQPHQRQGQVRQAHLRRLHLPDDEGDAGGEEGETLSGVVQEHLLDGRAVARHRGRIQGQEHKRLVAGLPGVGPNQGERR